MNHDDRDRSGCFLCCFGGVSGGRHDDIGLLRNRVPDGSVADLLG